MAEDVTLNEIDDDTIELNGKRVRRDSSGAWNADVELRPSEYEFLRAYIQEKRFD